MRKIITVANQVDGSGKTTTAVNLATSLALFEKSTLLVDCDPQRSATRLLETARAAGPTKNLYHVWTKKGDIDEIVCDTDLDFLHLIPAGPELFQADYRLAFKPGKEMVLRHALKPLADQYDYIIIDSPSSLGFLTFCALAAAETVLVPLHCHPEALTQLGFLLQAVINTRQELNPDLRISGIVLTGCADVEQARERISTEAFENIEGSLFPTTIDLSEDLQQALAAEKPVLLYDIMSAPSQRYLQLSAEVIEAVS